MNLFHELLQRVWYDPNPGFGVSILQAAFTPFGRVYGFFASRTRKNARPEALSTPVISVGNLTVGGTGKTTFVTEINTLLRENGKAGVILTRGHGRTSKKPLLLRKGVTPFPDCKEAGDEPLVLYRQCGDTPVLVGKNRVQNYHGYVAGHERPDFVLLDDGLHHHAIQKDINICLIDGKRQIGNGSCLPVGPLREPLSATPRPDVMVITRYDSQTDSKGMLDFFPGVPIVKTTFQIQSFSLLTGEEDETIPEKNVLLLSALGNNKQFRDSVEEAGFTVLEHHQFPDHHLYSADDIERLDQSARSKNVRAVLTTWKDAVKIEKWIKPDKESNIKWYACNLAVLYEEDGKEVLKNIVMKAFK